MATVDLMNLALPSANRKLAPPGWLLLAFWYCPLEAFEFGLDPRKAHQPNEYWPEDGGMIVLKRLKPPEFSHHRNPFWFTEPGPSLF